MGTTSITISVFAGIFGCAYFIESNMVLIVACVAMLIAPFLIKIDF